MTEIQVGSKWIDGRGSIFTVVSVSGDYVNFSDFSGYPHTLLKENWPGSMRWFGDAPGYRRPVGDAPRLSPEESGVLLAASEALSNLEKMCKGYYHNERVAHAIASNITTTAYAEIIAREQVRRQAAAMLDACVVVPVDQRVATGSFPHIDTKEEVVSETSEVKPKYSE